MELEYIKVFNNDSDYNDFISQGGFPVPAVHMIEESWEINYHPEEIEEEEVVIPDANGYSYIDLGLPSGLKWAKCNIGTEKETGYGLYFSWGEEVGYPDNKSGKNFEWSDYKHSSGTNKTLIKYNLDSSYGIVDNLTTLELSDDAASVILGGSWRIPTNNDYTEFLDNTTNQWTTKDGVNGRLFTSKINGNTLFFPAAGYSVKAGMGDLGVAGRYWSSSLDTSEVSWSNVQALRLYFDSSNCYVNGGARNSGFSIRGVIKI